MGLVEMAESSSDVPVNLQKLEEDVTCLVCKEHFKEPKLLPCLHYFCKPCIAQLIEGVPSGQSFKCPSCHLETTASNDNPERYYNSRVVIIWVDWSVVSFVTSLIYVFLVIEYIDYVIICYFLLVN